jgi:hypothetical protein
MKYSLCAFLAGSLILGGIFITPHFTHPRLVHAQGGCDLTSFTGAYGYIFNGYAYDPQNNVYIIASVGSLASDGNGGLTGGDTTNFDVTVLKRTFTGTYSINADCTGSSTLQMANGTSTSTAHGDIVAVNNAREVNFVQTDPNFIVSGTFKKQIQ